MEKIGIFCSASDNIDKMYFESAGQIGKWMGQTGKTLIYGGASLGLMECIARAVKETGGQGIGVVPAKLEENGKVSTLLWPSSRCRSDRSSGCCWARYSPTGSAAAPCRFRFWRCGPRTFWCRSPSRSSRRICFSTKNARTQKVKNNLVYFGPGIYRRKTKVNRFLKTSEKKMT